MTNVKKEAQVFSKPDSWVRQSLQSISASFHRKADPHEESSRIIIVIGGPNGGRAAFISTVSGQRVSPATKSVKAVTCDNPDGFDSHITLIDSPPLERDVVTLADIEVKVREWIKKRRAKIENFAGIVYMQSITDRTFKDPPFTLSSQFLDVEGSKLFQRCVIATTMWEQIDPATGIEREKELKRIWKDFIQAGSRVIVLHNTLESAQSLVHSLLAPPNESLSNEMSTTNVVLNQLPTEPDVPAAESLPLDDPRTTELPYIHSSYALGRHLDQTVILTVGKTGSGKSKTINRLIGENIFNVAEPGDGSTTKRPSRVTITFEVDKRVVKIAFDDTPGYEDTILENRHKMDALLHGYAQNYFPIRTVDHENALPGSTLYRDRIYPNAILIVATWNSVKADQNDVSNLTSDIGRSMKSLKEFGLVDLERKNVIVVITKCMTSYYSDYEDYDDVGKKEQWRKDANRKTGIVTGLQEKVFPESVTWPVIFIENGGGRHNLKTHKTLPNGETSHQNLFDAICELVTFREPSEVSDLNGISALHYLTGKLPASSTTRVHRDLDCTVKHKAEIMERETVSPANPPSACVDELARAAIGLTFNPINGKFGRSGVLAVNRSDVRITLSSGSQSEQILSVEEHKEDSKFIASQLRIDFQMRDIVGWNACYSASKSVISKLSSGSRLHVAKKLVAIAEVIPLRPRLSEELIKQIASLPRWSEQTNSQYCTFFETYGTHVVLRAALGGMLWIASRDYSNVDFNAVKKHLSTDMNVPIMELLAAQVGAGAGHVRNKHKEKSNETSEINVFLEGGGNVGAELSAAVEQVFAYFQNPSSPAGPGNWPIIRAKWIDALNTQPVFCPDHRQTDYWWLYNFDGLTDEQREDLQLASKAYLQQREDTSTSAPPTDVDSVELPRQQNLERVKSIFKSAMATWRAKFLGRVQLPRH